MENKKEEKEEVMKKKSKVKVQKFFEIINKFIWFLIGLIILASIGKYLLFKNMSKRVKIPEVKEVPHTINWEEVNNKIKESLKIAEEKAKNYAKRELQKLNLKLKERIDKDFLPWYFSYFTQQKFGILYLFHEGIHKLFTSYPSGVEYITEEIQKEFANRVLKPAIFKMELNQIAENSLKIFLSSLSEELSKIPEEYHIPQYEWENYLHDITITITGVEANRQISLSLKALTIGVVGGTIKILKITPKLKKVMAKVAEKIAAKIGNKIVIKVAEKFAAKLGTEVAGGVIGIGILFWDLWDHHRTVKINKPILRKNLYEYIDLITKMLLEDSQNGVLSPVYEIEEQIITKL